MSALHLVETHLTGPHEDPQRLGAAVVVNEHFVAVLHAGESPAAARAVQVATGLFLRNAVSDDPVDAAFQISYAVRRSGETLHAVVYDRRHARVWQLGGCQWRSDTRLYPARVAGDLAIVELGPTAELVLATASYTDISGDVSAAERALTANRSRAWARLVGVANSADALPLAS